MSGIEANENAAKIGYNGPIPLTILFASCLASVIFLLISLILPNVEPNGFRTSQTAISIYWMLHGAPWLDYWTPVLGPGWSIPFEFPLYQWLVAALCAATGLSVAHAGMLTSYAWLIIGIWPASYLFRTYGLPRYTHFFYAALLLTSPQYLLWGRAVLIESQAITLGVAFLAAVRAWSLSTSWTRAGLAALIGVAAALTKVTTAPPFFFGAAFIGLGLLIAHFKDMPRVTKLLAQGALIFLPALLATLWWNHHADSLKADNPIGIWLQSSQPSLMTWNFGTLHQRFSPALIIALAKATINGIGWTGVPVMLACIFQNRWFKPENWNSRPFKFFLICLAGFILPFFIFTNLHIVHSYYQSANALFLIAALAIAAATALDSGSMRHGWALGLLVLAIVGNVATFATHGLEQITHPDWRERYIGLTLKAHSKPMQRIAIYGLDWSSVAPFHAERRALMEPDWTAPEQARSRLAAAMRGLDDGSYGAIARCPSRRDKDPAFVEMLAQLAEGHAHVRTEDCTIYFAQARN